MRVGDVSQIFDHDLEDLVSGSESPILVSSSLFIDLMNEDGSEKGIASAHN